MSPENSGYSSNIIQCKHEPKNLFKTKSNYFYCYGCSSIIYLNESGKLILPAKPQKYNVMQETVKPIFMSVEDTHCPYRFYNKESYLEIRTKIVKKMKLFAQKFNLSKKTFFVALDYFDRLCSKLAQFNFAVVQIAEFCVVLASKFQDDSKYAITAKLSLGYSKNYAKDELYILQLLNYELYSITSYDILMDIMNVGIFFNNEKFSRNKMNIIYGKIEKMLYFFSETKYFIEMTPMEIALSVVGFVRETLGLTAYNNIIKDIYMPRDDVKRYLICLSKFRKCFKILDNNSHNRDVNTKSNIKKSNNYKSAENNSINSGNINENVLKNSLIEEKIK